MYIYTHCNNNDYNDNTNKPIILIITYNNIITYTNT